MEKHPQDKIPLLTTESGEQFDIPKGGSLGLLALGYKGVLLWRKERKSKKKIQLTTNEQNKLLNRVR